MRQRVHDRWTKNRGDVDEARHEGDKPHLKEGNAHPEATGQGGAAADSTWLSAGSRALPWAGGEKSLPAMCCPWAQEQAALTGLQSQVPRVLLRLLMTLLRPRGKTTQDPHPGHLLTVSPTWYWAAGRNGTPGPWLKGTLPPFPALQSRKRGQLECLVQCHRPNGPAVRRQTGMWAQEVARPASWSHSPKRPRGLYQRPP